MNNTIIDLELGKKLINSDQARAKDMLTMLIDMLPAHEQGIKTAHDNSNHDAFAAEVHKFRGGVCYCGTPQLQETSSALETALKQTVSHDEIETLYQNMLDAIENFKKEYNNLQ